MKNIYSLFYGALILLIAFSYSCQKNDVGSVSAPTILKVRTISQYDTIYNVVRRITLDSSISQTKYPILLHDSTVVSGGLGNQYAIIGTNMATTKTVSFNGVQVYFNPALLTDHSIIITIPGLTSTAAQVPYGPSQSNKLVVVTKHGTVSYNFPIKQPVPVILSFAPQVANSGDTIVIKGLVFDGASAVTFDKIPATIIGTPTTSTIRVVVPVGVTSNFIYVTTPGGTAVSSTNFGFKYVIFTESLTAGWGGQGSGGYDGYNSVRTYNDKTQPESGSYDISCQFTNQYGALQLGYGGATAINVKALGLTALKFSIYAGKGYTAGQKIQVVINGGYGSAAQVTVKAGAYTDFVVPLSSLGNPTVINELVLQNLGVSPPCTIYIDNLGFI